MEDENQAAVTGASQLPDPARFPLHLGLLDDDGEACRRFSADGAVEVVVVAKEAPADRGNVAGRVHVADGVATRLRTWAIPIPFQTYEAAEAAGKVLAAALDAVNHLAAAEPATLGDGHWHSIRLERFARNGHKQAVCGRCMTVIADDVREWLAQHPGNVPAHPATVVEILETYINRDFGSDAVENARHVRYRDAASDVPTDQQR